MKLFRKYIRFAVTFSFFVTVNPQLTYGTKMIEDMENTTCFSVPKKNFDEKICPLENFQTICINRIENFLPQLTEELRIPATFLLSSSLFAIRGEDSPYHKDLENNNLFFISTESFFINKKFQKLKCSLKENKEIIYFYLTLVPRQTNYENLNK